MEIQHSDNGKKGVFFIEENNEKELDLSRLLKNTLYIKDGKFKIKNWQFDKLTLEEEDNHYIDESGNKWFSEFRGLGLNLLIDIDGEIVIGFDEPHIAELLK